MEQESSGKFLVWSVHAIYASKILEKCHLEDDIVFKCLYYRPLLYFVPELDIFDNVAPSKDELLSPKFWFEEDLVENGILEAAEDKEYFYNLGGFFSSLFYEEKSVFESFE